MLSTSVRQRLALESAGINSVEIAASILTAIAMQGRPATLKEISDTTRIPGSKLHRYLTSMVKANLVFQADKSQPYALGKMCAQLGLAAMRQSNLFTRVETSLPVIVEQTNAHTYMVIWSTSGPMLFKYVFSDDTAIVNAMPGQILPLLRSSSGRLFAALMPEQKTQTILQLELIMAERRGDDRERLLGLIGSAARDRWSITRGELDGHLMSLSVPVLDWHDSNIVVIGCAMEVDTPDDRVNAVLKVLQKHAQGLSMASSWNAGSRN